MYCNSEIPLAFFPLFVDFHVPLLLVGLDPPDPGAFGLGCRPSWRLFAPKEELVSGRE